MAAVPVAGQGGNFPGNGLSRDGPVRDGDAADDGADEEQHRGDLQQPGEAGIGERAGSDESHAGHSDQRRSPTHDVLDRCGDPAVLGLDGGQIERSQGRDCDDHPDGQHDPPGQQVCDDVESGSGRADEQDPEPGQHGARHQENPRSDPRGQATDAAGQQQRQDGAGQGNQTRLDGRKTGDLLDVEAGGKRAQHEGAVDERSDQIGAGEVAVREQSQRQHGVRGAALPCHKGQQDHDPGDHRCGDEEVVPAAPLRFDHCIHGGGQPDRRQCGSGDVEAGVVGGPGHRA